MPARAPVSEDRLKQSFEQSRQLVRSAHERCEQAAKRSRLMREWVRRSHQPQPQSPGSSVLRLAFEEAERANRERERFMAVVSHELRQPLNAIVAALRVLETAANADAHSRAQTIMARQIRQMIHLMDDLLDMSRLQVQSILLQVTRMDLWDVVEAALETVAAAACEQNTRLIR